MEQICNNLSSFHQNKKYIYPTNKRSSRKSKSKPKSTSFFSRLMNWNNTPNKSSSRLKRSRSSFGSKKRSVLKVNLSFLFTIF